MSRRGCNTYARSAAPSLDAQPAQVAYDVNLIRLPLVAIIAVRRALLSMAVLKQLSSGEILKSLADS